MCLYKLVVYGFEWMPWVQFVKFFYNNYYLKVPDWRRNLQYMV